MFFQVTRLLGIRIRPVLSVARLFVWYICIGVLAADLRRVLIRDAQQISMEYPSAVPWIIHELSVEKRIASTSLDRCLSVLQYLLYF